MKSSRSWKNCATTALGDWYIAPDPEKALSHTAFVYCVKRSQSAASASSAQMSSMRAATRVRQARASGSSTQ